MVNTTSPGDNGEAMNPSSVMTIQALVLALLQLDVQLPDDLRQAIWQLKKDLAQHSAQTTEEACDIARRHARLDELFHEEYRKLEQRSDIQERAKMLVTHGNLTNGSGAEAIELSWNDVVLSILSADDFRVAAEALLKRVHAHKGSLHASGDVLVFLSALQRVLEVSNTRAIAVLKALEKRPLTLRNLVYVLGIPFEQLQAIVQRLWQDGYIDRFTGGALQILTSWFRSRPRYERVDPDTHLTLTSKGHFYLHPVIRVGRREGRFG